MADLEYTRSLVAGTPENINDVQTMFNDVKSYVNGSGWVDNGRLAASVAATNLEASGELAEMGISNGSTVRRGKCIVAGAETTTSASATYLTTPDKVADVVLPTDGLIFVSYAALWRATGAAATAVAALPLDDVALQDLPGTASSAPEASQSLASVGDYYPLTTAPNGLTPSPGGSPTASGSGSVATTGVCVGGGVCAIFAAAGTYDVGVKFYRSSGSGTVSVSSRKLWVWTVGF